MGQKMIIKRLLTQDEIDKAIKSCDDAFCLPISSRSIYKSLLGKISALGVVLAAYSTDINGYIAFYANDYNTKTAFISLIAVKNQFQNRKIGKKLLQECERFCKNNGMNKLELEVRSDNYIAQLFYRKNGFTSIGKCGQEMIRMCKVLKNDGEDNYA